MSRYDEFVFENTATFVHGSPCAVRRQLLDERCWRGKEFVSGSPRDVVQRRPKRTQKRAAVSGSSISNIEHEYIGWHCDVETTALLCLVLKRWWQRIERSRQKRNGFIDRTLNELHRGYCDRRACLLQLDIVNKRHCLTRFHNAAARPRTNIPFALCVRRPLFSEWKVNIIRRRYEWTSGEET